MNVNGSCAGAVVNEYFHKHFPNAIITANQTRAQGKRQWVAPLAAQARQPGRCPRCMHSVTHLRFTPTPLRTAPFVPLAKLAIGILNGGPLYTYTRPVEHRHVATHTFSRTHTSRLQHTHTRTCALMHTLHGQVSLDDAQLAD